MAALQSRAVLEEAALPSDFHITLTTTSTAGTTRGGNQGGAHRTESLQPVTWAEPTATGWLAFD
ncbi:rCG50869 [Rattus norvegicus]|uniref:RCG50869 n=1 Tax=Rattus norvegicus TaxID=10116 RepID=A6KJ50_RAT|nr:rCG50869 [Rattus norvegicus]